MTHTTEPARLSQKERKEQMRAKKMVKKRTRAPKYVYVMRNGHFVKVRVTKIVTFVFEEVKEAVS